MTDAQLRALLQDVEAILLDFDGPVTQLLPPGPNAEVAAAAREPLIAAGYDLPADLGTTTDHIAVLRFSATVNPATRQDVETICRELEVKAAQNSAPTPGADRLLEVCATQGLAVVVASNNDAAAVETYLDRMGLRGLVVGMVGRPRGHPELMKPEPHIVREARALSGYRPEHVVMIGDAVSDVVASHAAGVRVIGYAKRERRGEELAAAGADAIAVDLAQITWAVVQSI